MKPQPRCLYCNKGSDETALFVNQEKHTGFAASNHYYCSETCHNDAILYEKRVNEKSTRFLVLILGAALSFLPFMLMAFLTPFSKLFASLSTAFPLILVGIVIYIYPFSTPETLKLWGIRKSLRVLKWLSYILVFAGLAFGLVVYLIG
jgi:hypothetical protein